MLFLKTQVFHEKYYLSKYAVVGCKVYGDVWVHVYAFWVHVYAFWVHVYAFWVHVYGSVGCMYAVVGCKVCGYVWVHAWQKVACLTVGSYVHHA